jgi:hypothetical protein
MRGELRWREATHCSAQLGRQFAYIFNQDFAFSIC